MKWQKATMIFIGILILAITAWDIFVLVDGGTESSISYVMLSWAYKYPIFPFIMGLTMGHLFWRVKNVKGTNKLGK